jgi:hypothetical protein
MISAEERSLLSRAAKQSGSALGHICAAGVPEGAQLAGSPCLLWFSSPAVSRRSNAARDNGGSPAYSWSHGCATTAAPAGVGGRGASTAPGDPFNGSGYGGDAGGQYRKGGSVSSDVKPRHISAGNGDMKQHGNNRRAV